MSARWWAVIGIGLLGVQANAGEKDRLETQKDKLSYAMGVAVAKNLQRQGLDTNPEVLARGLRDGFSGGKLLLSDDELRAALAEERQKRREALAAAKDRKAAGAAFRAENAKKEGVVTLPSGVQYEILKAAVGRTPTDGDTVECNYRGSLIDGRMFDSSYQRGRPARIALARATSGWKEILKLMPVGSTWKVVVPPEVSRVGHGRGRKGKVLRDETLVYEVELLGIPSSGQGGSGEKTASATPPSR